MKLLTAGAAALIVLTAGAGAATEAAAQTYKSVTVNQNGKKVVRKTTVRPNGSVRTTVRRKWTAGQRLPASYYGSNYAVDYRRYHLRQPPAGHRWVRRDNQFLLVALTTGAVISAIAASQ
jgi:Ni/Co efflux regulator RcnB